MSTNSGVDRTQQALFDADLAAWRSQPERAFDGWLASHGFGQATAVVYRAMWGKLLRWSGERGLVPLGWSAQQIGEFLDAQQLHKHHRYRYARLIERVFHHLAGLQQGLHNPATQAVRARLADGENDPMAFLLPVERDCLISQLAAACAGPNAQGECSPTQWKRARDLALLAVLLGAGLKVGQVRALGLDQFADGYQAVRMARPDNGRAYEAPLLAFARPALAAWLEVRASGGALGPLVFPATPDGRAMHAASVYRRIERLLEQAGVLDGRSERASPQTLRNTYGALHFDAGAGPAAVAQYLGMRDLESGWRLRAAYEAWMARSGQMGDHDAPAAPA